MSKAMALYDATPRAVDLPPLLDQAKIDLIKRTVFPQATDLELQMFVNLCNTKRLDPLTRQIYAIKTKTGAVQMFASIDGLRVIARRTGEYGGQTAPFWCGPDGQWRDVWLDDAAPAAAKVGVYIRGCEHPTWGVATLRSYGHGKTGNWQTMPDVMLAKCAEAQALRKAFPDDLSGLYVREEFDAGDDAPTVAAERQRRSPLRSDARLPRAQRDEQLEHLAPSPRVVDDDTGEIETLAEIDAAIKEAREALGWSGRDAVSAATEAGINPKTHEGRLQLRDHLQSLVTRVFADAEDGQGELAIEAEVVAGSGLGAWVTT